MKRKALFFATLFMVSVVATAQNLCIDDDFSDGNFTHNPQWVGDTACFVVANNVLRLSGSHADSSFLSTPLRLSGADTLQWSVWVKHNSLTSNNSFIRLYLYSNSANPYHVSEGMYVEVKPRTAATLSVRCVQPDGVQTLVEPVPYKLQPTNAGQMRLRATRLPNGLWTLDIDTLGGYDFAPLASFVEPDNYMVGQYGFYTIWCRYTANDKTKFFVDDVVAKPLVAVVEPEPEVMPMVGDVLINEVLFNPYDGGGDFVELYNNTDSAIALGNICMATWDKGIDGIKTIVPMPEGVVVLPHDYVVVTTDAYFLLSHYTVAYPYKVVEVGKLPSYPNAGGSVVVALADSTVIDRFDYTEDMHYRWLTDVEGVSLERRSFSEPTQSAGNWHSAAKSAGWATPTAHNSQAVNMLVADDAFDIEPNIFSPDGDGYNDVLAINYRTAEGNLFANISVFDHAGRMVKAVERNAFLGTNGTFEWNGIDDNGRPCNMGNYIVLIEVYDPNGASCQFKKVVTLMYKR